MNNFINQGWQCPICKNINAPWVQQCPCEGKSAWITSTGSIPPDNATTYYKHECRFEGTD